MLNKLKRLKETLKRNKQEREYSEKVLLYLSKREGDFFYAWVEACERNYGRISYDDMEVILGSDYPKATWIPKDDNKRQIIAFVDELEIPYRVDENDLFFP